MRINDKYFSFPPYISTSWAHVKALYMKDSILFIHLVDGQIISIPELKPELIELIFKAHAAHLEKEVFKEHQQKGPAPHVSGVASIFISPDKMGGELPFKLNGNSFEMLSSTMQHNPSLANAPDLPKDLIQKISSIAKIVHGEDPLLIPKAEPHCNCFYCQIARGIHDGAGGVETKKSTEQAVEEEVVSDAELQFQQWEVTQTGDKLFSVMNKLDQQEKYTVFLGQPVGCTCGKSGCEHILAVLKT